MTTGTARLVYPCGSARLPSHSESVRSAAPFEVLRKGALTTYGTAPGSARSRPHPPRERMEMETVFVDEMTWTAAVSAVARVQLARGDWQTRIAVTAR